MTSRALSIPAVIVITLATVAFPSRLFAQEAAPSASAPSRGTEIRFESPEDAIVAYLDGFARADLDEILSVSAADEMAQGFRHELLVDRTRSFALTMDGPTHDRFFADLQQLGWDTQVLGQVRILAYSLLAPDLLGDALDGVGLFDVDAQWALDLQSRLDSPRLASLAVVDIGVPEPALSQSPNYVAATTKTAEMYGADEMAERVALVGFEDETYAVGFTLLRYGDDWQVKSQSSPLSGLSAFGAARAMTRDDFEALILED
jgi:hypothetical protein